MAGVVCPQHLVWKVRYQESIHRVSMARCPVSIGSQVTRQKSERAQDLEGRMVKRMQRTMSDRQLLRPGQKVLVAVSGGQDSVCLIHLLSLLQPNWNWMLGIVHCDHQWSSSSRLQASHVAEIATGLQIDYFQAVTTKPVLGEGVARVWRYGILQKIALSHGYEAIVTAHTASDRVETMLYNLFRGSGLRGLQSLAWKRLLSPSLSLCPQVAFLSGRVVVRLEDSEGRKQAVQGDTLELVRPLLDTTRTELKLFCIQTQLPLWPDPSNHSMEIHRNRIRHQLLPYLRQHFQPEIDKSLARCAEILQCEDVYLNDLCRSIRRKAETTHYSPDGVERGKKLNISPLQALPAALQRRILKDFVECYTGKSATFDLVERLRLTSLHSHKSLQLSIPGGFCLQFCGGEMILSKHETAVPVRKSRETTS